MCGWVVEEGRGCLEEDSRPECDMLARRVSFSVSCKARESPVRRTSLQEEVGVDGWIGKKEASALKKKRTPQNQCGIMSIQNPVQSPSLYWGFLTSKVGITAECTSPGCHEDSVRGLLPCASHRVSPSASGQETVALISAIVETLPCSKEQRTATRLAFGVSLGKET